MNRRAFIFQDIKLICPKPGLRQFLLLYWQLPTFKVLFWFRLIQYKIMSNHRMGLRILRIKYNTLCNKYMCTLPIETTVGEGLVFPHGFPIVINSKARIGKNVIIHPCVLIGRDRGKEGAPVIGDCCFIGHGVKIIGNPVIGEYCFISPGAVVTKNIPSNTLVGAGVNNILNSTGRDHYLQYRVTGGEK